MTCFDIFEVFTMPKTQNHSLRSSLWTSTSSYIFSRERRISVPTWLTDTLTWTLF